eukprot:jgi/Astpho2/3985/Aster-01158
MRSAPVSLQHSPQGSPAEGRMRGGRRPCSAQQSLQQAPGGAEGAAASAASRRRHTAGSVEGPVGAASAARPGHRRQLGSAQTAGSGSTGSSGASQQVTTGSSADLATDAELQADSAGMGTWAGRQTRFPWAERTASQFSNHSGHRDSSRSECGSPRATSYPEPIPGSPAASKPPRPPAGGAANGITHRDVQLAATASAVGGPLGSAPPGAPQATRADSAVGGDAEEDELAARQATGAAATTSCRQGDKGAEGQQPGARVRRRSSDMEEERIREAAWRWRFGRRWCAE